jgi:hypothetical protein
VALLGFRGGTELLAVFSEPANREEASEFFGARCGRSGNAQPPNLHLPCQSMRRRQTGQASVSGDDERSERFGQRRHSVSRPAVRQSGLSFANQATKS